MSKNRFATGTNEYLRYRPTYPDALYEYLVSLCVKHNQAWDCATGNGQAAVALARYFKQVLATDISPEQLALATPHERVTYQTAPAESSGLPDCSVDLITVAAAIHWFDFEHFYAEAKRALQPQGVIAAWVYFGPRTSAEIDALTDYYSFEVLGDYWDKRMAHVFSRYQTLPFPFEEITPPPFQITIEWNLEELLGFFGTFSGGKVFEERHGVDPRTLVKDKFVEVWDDPSKKRMFTLDIALRVGR